MVIEEARFTPAEKAMLESIKAEVRAESKQKEKDRKKEEAEKKAADPYEQIRNKYSHPSVDKEPGEALDPYDAIRAKYDRKKG